MPRRSLAYYSPTDLSGLVAWFKADSLALSDGDAIATWADSGSGANDATQSTAGNKPTYKASIINGKPVVRFDGGDGLVVANESNFDIATPTVFFVATRSSGSGALTGKSTTGFGDGRRRKLQFVLGATSFVASSGADGVSYSTTVSTTAVPAIYVYRSSSDTSHDVSYNGTNSTSTTTLSESSSNFNNASLIIGSNFAAGTESFTGDIAEIIIFNRYLSDEESFGVQNYLANKYNITNDVIGGYPRTALTNRIRFPESSGYSLNFDGTNDRVTINNNASHNSLTGSWSFWVKLSADKTGNGNSIMSKNDAGSSANGINVYLTSNNIINAQIKSGASSVCEVVGSKRLILGRWYHFIITFVNNGAVTTYIDGIQDFSGSMSGTFVFNNQNLLIGENVDGYWSDFNGKIDSVRLFNTNLNATQAFSLYRNVVDTSIVSEYLFDEGSGTTVTDSKGVQNGSITNATYSTDVPLGVRSAK